MRSLWMQLAGGLLALALLFGFGLLFWFQYSSGMLRIETEQRLHRDLARFLVADNPLLQQGGRDVAALENTFHTMMVLGPAFEFYLLDRHGRLQVYSAEPGKVVRQQVALTPILHFLNGEPLPLLGEDPRSLERHKIFSAAPLPGDPSGYLYVIIGGERYDNLFAQLRGSRSVLHSVLILGSGVLLSVIIGLLLFFRLTRPLARLSRQMAGFRAGGFAAPEPPRSGWRSSGGNEVDQLGAVFAELAQRITGQMRQLNEVDASRRELVAHISHDLRTPLTSLLGYLQTWQMRRPANADTQQQHCIDGALSSARQLDQLVNQLMELARLDCGRAELQLEPVAIAELAQDVLARFALQARQQGVRLVLQPPGKHLLVYADIGMLERVLGNLLDNALRHTDAGGRVQIAVSEQGRQVRVEVNDSGCGIPAAELDKVLLPHYRASNRKESSNMGAGLGLAITEKLLRLHDSRLEINSELGLGSRFSFALQPLSMAPAGSPSSESP